MPKGYEDLKKNTIKQYGKKKGTIIAAKIWNKQNKGTGKTVGKGRS